MAHDQKTLADLILVNDLNLYEADISDLLQDSPFIATIAADTSSNGTQHKYLKETGAMPADYRDPNVGRDHGKSVDTLVQFDLKHLDATFHVDQAIANQYTKGGAAAYVGIETMRAIRASFFKTEQQSINGQAEGDPLGFLGLADTHAALDPQHTISGGGAANVSSVYAVRTGRNDAQVIMGEDGMIFVGDTEVNLVSDNTNTNKLFPAYVTPVSMWTGFQVGSIWSTARLANVDDLTDDLLSDLLSLFPAGRAPSYLVMNRRSLWQLQKSRQSFNPTGQPATVPNQAHNVPIIITEAIGNAETVVI